MRQIDRTLAIMSIGLIVLSVICFLAVMIGSGNGADMQTGVWPAVGLIVMFAPIAAFLMLLSVVIMTFVRRARAGRGR